MNATRFRRFERVTERQIFIAYLDKPLLSLALLTLTASYSKYDLRILFICILYKLWKWQHFVDLIGLPEVWRNRFTEATVPRLSGRGHTEAKRYLPLKDSAARGTQWDTEQGQPDRHATDGPTGRPPEMPLACFWGHSSGCGWDWRSQCHGGASQSWTAAGKAPERGADFRFWKWEKHMAEREGEGDTLPEGTAGQLPGDVPQERGLRERTGDAERGLGQSGRGGSRGRRRGSKAAHRSALDREDWVLWNLTWQMFFSIWD